MASPDHLDAEAAVLEAQAIEFEEKKRVVAAQARLQQAKSKRGQAAILRQQTGEIDGSIGLLGC